MQIDKSVLIDCANNDRRAQKKLYEICFRVFMPLCLRYNQNEEDARFAFNNAFLKINSSLQTANLEEINFFGLAKKIVTNVLIDEYRKSKNYTTHYLNKETDRELEIHSENTANEAEGNFEYKVLMKLIDEIPQTHSLVFKLFVIEGFSHKEIADELKISEGTSKWHLSVARKLLREKLEKIDSHVEKRMVV
ncbi:MAG: sigma-70 family RNA polymerase sigma factor [Bacteroidota bacterium]